MQPVQREASGLDQQPDRVGTVVGQAEQDALASVLGRQVGLDGVIGIPQQPPRIGAQGGRPADVLRPAAVTKAMRCG